MEQFKNGCFFNIPHQRVRKMKRKMTCSWDPWIILGAISGDIHKSDGRVLSPEHWPSPSGLERAKCYPTSPFRRGESRRCPGSQPTSMAPLCSGRAMSFSSSCLKSERVRWYQRWHRVKTSGITSSHRGRERLAVPCCIVKHCTTARSGSRPRPLGCSGHIIFNIWTRWLQSPQLLLQSTCVLAGGGAFQYVYLFSS